MFGALAEFERNLIRERTYAGLTAARARGRKVADRRCWNPPNGSLSSSCMRKKQHYNLRNLPNDGHLQTYTL